MTPAKIDFYKAVMSIILILLGSIAGHLIPKYFQKNFSFLNLPPNSYYKSGLSIVLAVFFPLLYYPTPIDSDIILLSVEVLISAVIGFLCDIKYIKKRVGILLLTVLFIFQAIAKAIFIDISLFDFLVEITWSPIVVVSFIAASVVFEMPFIMAIVSGTTFLLFFQGQIATPPEAYIFTFAQIIPSFIVLLNYLIFKKIVNPGTSGLMALGALIARISMLGKSKTLLLFGLLFPAMATIFPVLGVSFIIITSYLANELYSDRYHKKNFSYLANTSMQSVTNQSLNNPHSCTIRYHTWFLSRDIVVFYTSIIFIILNFALLLFVVKAPILVWIFLVVLIFCSFTGFMRTFAKKITINPESLYNQQKVKLFDIFIDSITFEQVISKIENWLNCNINCSEMVNLDQNSENKFYHIVTLDSLALLRTIEDSKFKEIVSKADLVIPDGAGIIWAADFLGTSLPQRIPGVSLLQELCAFSELKNWKIYLLGAKPEVIKETVNKLLYNHPNLQIVGYNDGYINENTKPSIYDVIDDILSKKPDLLFVGMGVPKQEEFIDKLRQNYNLHKPLVAMGVGGSFDVISGMLPRAPLIMQRFALEWLYRLWLEPSRIIRIIKIPKFVNKVLKAKIQNF